MKIRFRISLSAKKKKTFACITRSLDYRELIKNVRKSLINTVLLIKKMQRSSSLLRPLKSGSFAKDNVDHKKIDNLPVYSPKNERKIINNVNSKLTASKSKKLFIFFIVFGLIMFGVILHRIFLTYNFSYIRREKVSSLKKSYQNNKNYDKIQGDTKINNAEYHTNNVELNDKNKKINQDIGIQIQMNDSLNNSNVKLQKDSKRKSNFRRKMSEEELQEELELELMANPVLENLDEEDVKRAIENGEIDKAVEEAQEIEEILEEIEERRNERRQKGFRGKKN